MSRFVISKNVDKKNGHKMSSTQKVLYLIRHAKSAWDRPGMSDWERDLNERGRRDGPRMSKYFAENFVKPDILLSSDSQRTRSTAQYFLDAGWVDQDSLTFHRDLYLASHQEIIDRLVEMPDSVQSIGILAHNPGIHQTVIRLSQSESISKFPTFAMAHLTTQAESWALALKSRWSLESFLYPKKLFMD